MSDEPKELYYQNFNQQGTEGSMYCDQKQLFSSLSAAYDSSQLAFDPSSYMSFTECLQGGGGGMDYNSLIATSFGLSPSSSEVFSSVEGNHHHHHHHQKTPAEAEAEAEAGEEDHNMGDGGTTGGGGAAGSETLLNSSISSSSTEAGAEEDSGKRKKDGKVKEEQSSKNG